MGVKHARHVHPRDKAILRALRGTRPSPTDRYGRYHGTLHCLDRGKRHASKATSLQLYLSLKLKLKLFTTCTVCAGFYTKNPYAPRRLLSVGPPNYAIQGTYKSGLDR
jgi:hypothetical protein